MRKGNPATAQLSLVDRPTTPLDEGELGCMGPTGMDRGQIVDGKYELVEPAGQGGMSVVFRAIDLRLKRTVAIKIMHPREASDTRFWESFSREAESMARLRHHNVIEIYDIGRVDGFAYLVMPYHEGPDLVGWAAEHLGPPVSPDAALRLLTQACDGVHALHAHGVVHGDIKPTNLLVSPSLDVKVADLGMAWHMSDPRNQARTGGTTGFMAPELLLRLDEPSQAAKADVYGLAVTTYWLLTGHMPVDGVDMVEVMRQQLAEQIVPPSQRLPSLPSTFDEPLLRALCPRPTERPDAQGFRDELLAAQASAAGFTACERPRVVVVDDDPNSLMLVEEIVRCAVPEAELLTYQDPHAALAALEHGPCSLVITDLHMPEVSGADLIVALRSRPQTTQTPIIVMTGVGSAVDWQVLSNLGAHRFVVKPIAEDMLHDMVRRAVAAPALRRV